MTLQELITHCAKYDIDPGNVTFGFGHKEAYACFSAEDYFKFAKTEDDFETCAKFEEWRCEQEWSAGEWEESIRIY